MAASTGGYHVIVTGWYDTKDALPIDGEAVLGYYPEGDLWVSYDHEYREWRTEFGYQLREAPFAWRNA